MKQYNSTKEAIAALEDGKKVSFYDNQLQITIEKNHSFEKLGLSGYTFDDLFNGTWVIEN